MVYASELCLDLNGIRFWGLLFNKLAWFWGLLFNKLAWFWGRDFLNYVRVLRNVKCEVIVLL